MKLPALANVGVGLSFAAVVVMCGFQVWAEEEVVAGSTAAGQLKIDIGFEQPLALGVFPGITGYATGEMGFHSAAFDDPANDFYQLSTLADFRFILLAKDPGMEVWNDHGSSYMATNDFFYIGPPPYDTHPIWNIVNGTPGRVYSLTLKIRDLNHIYPDSAPFVLSFTPLVLLPRINLKPADAHHATLSWTTNATGWELESAGALTATNWITITNVPALTGTNFVLSITTAEARQFFRLRQP